MSELAYQQPLGLMSESKPADFTAQGLRELFAALNPHVPLAAYDELLTQFSTMSLSSSTESSQVRLARRNTSLAGANLIRPRSRPPAKTSAGAGQASVASYALRHPSFANLSPLFSQDSSPSVARAQLVRAQDDQASKTPLRKNRLGFSFWVWSASRGPRAIFLADFSLFPRSHHLHTFEHPR